MRSQNAARRDNDTIHTSFLEPLTKLILYLMARGVSGLYIVCCRVDSNWRSLCGIEVSSVSWALHPQWARPAGTASNLVARPDLQRKRPFVEFQLLR